MAASPGEPLTSLRLVGVLVLDRVAVAAKQRGCLPSLSVFPEIARSVSFDE
jgi:hypothetical protein